MKIYKEPIMGIINLNIDDCIRTSAEFEEETPGDNNLPWVDVCFN